MRIQAASAAIAIFVVAGGIICRPVHASAQPVFPSVEPITRDDRILIFAPHPDDEVLGCAGVIQKAVQAGAPVNVVYLTNGELNQLANVVYEKRLTLLTAEFIRMGEVRSQEAREAMRLLGVPEQDLIFLGYPDFGTFKVLTSYWQTTKPFKSLTRISSVSSKDNFSSGALYTGESILNDLKRILVKVRPTRIFVTHPSETNGDHLAMYLFVQIALSDVGGAIASPKVYQYLIHSLQWPLPRKYHPELRLDPPPALLNSSASWSELDLSREEVELKNKALACYKSQMGVSAGYLLSFVRANELFGDYPEIPAQVPVSTAAGNAGESLRDIAYGVQDGLLTMRIGKSREYRDRLGATVYLFGYSSQSPFPLMPKLRIVLRGDAMNVFNGRKHLRDKGVVSEKTEESVLVHIPLKVLGEPESIFVLVKVSGKFLRPDYAAFRRVRIGAPQ